MDPLLTGIGPVAAMIGVVVAAWFTHRGSNRKLRSDAGNQMIDQHQEEIQALRAEITELKRAVRIQGDYIGELRRHIADGKPPPSPPWPAGILA